MKRASIIGGVVLFTLLLPAGAGAELRRVQMKTLGMD